MLFSWRASLYVPVNAGASLGGCRERIPAICVSARRAPNRRQNHQGSSSNTASLVLIEFGAPGLPMQIPAELSAGLAVSTGLSVADRRDQLLAKPHLAWAEKVNKSVHAGEQRAPMPGGSRLIFKIFEDCLSQQAAQKRSSYRKLWV